MAKGKQKESCEESPNLNTVVLDMDELILPYIKASRKANEWGRSVGIPDVRQPDIIELEFNPDLSMYSNSEIGTLMNVAQEIKRFYRGVMADMTSKVRDRQRALDVLSRTIKKLMRRDGFRGSETALTDEVKTDMRVIKADQFLVEAQDKLEKVTAYYKSVDDQYKTLSRNVTLITDENETFRRVDRVEGMRRGHRDVKRRGRRADRVAVNVASTEWEAEVDDDE